MSYAPTGETGKTCRDLPRKLRMPWMKAFRFLFNVQPLELVVGQDGQGGQVTGVKIISTRLGNPDERGRRRPENIPGTEETLPADAVIMAFGFKPDPPEWLKENQIDLTEKSLIRTSTLPSSSHLFQRHSKDISQSFPFQTSNPKVFAGGGYCEGIGSGGHCDC